MHLDDERLAPGLRGKQAVQQAVRIDSQLLGDPVGDDLRRLSGLREERTEKPDCTQLHRKPEPVVIAAAPVDQRAVSLVEVKEPLKLHHRRRLGVATIGSDLHRAQEIDRHALSTPGGASPDHDAPPIAQRRLPSRATVSDNRRKEKLIVLARR